MNDRSFDRLTRRTSLMTLGVGGLVALVSPLTAVAKHNKAKNKNKNKTRNKNKTNNATTTNANEAPANVATANEATKKCETQNGQCTTFLTTACLGDAACLARTTPCCAFAGQCDFTGFITCLQQAVSG